MGVFLPRPNRANREVVGAVYSPRSLLHSRPIRSHAETRAMSTACWTLLSMMVVSIFAEHIRRSAHRAQPEPLLDIVDHIVDQLLRLIFAHDLGFVDCGVRHVHGLSRIPGNRGGKLGS